MIMGRRKSLNGRVWDILKKWIFSLALYHFSGSRRQVVTLNTVFFHCPIFIIILFNQIFSMIFASPPQSSNLPFYAQKLDLLFFQFGRWAHTCNETISQLELHSYQLDLVSIHLVQCLLLAQFSALEYCHNLLIHKFW